MRIYFIRHTTVNVPPQTCYGSTDVPLNDTFEEEASKVKQKLEGIVFDQAYTSPLTRAVKLAEFCGYPDAIRDDRVKEFNFGKWEMRNYNDLYMNEPYFKQWCDDYINQRCPEGESDVDDFETNKSIHR